MPQVIGAYLKGDDAVLRTACREQAYALLHASVMERQARQLKMDPRILHMSDPEIVGYRIIGGNPTPVVSFEAHQLHCVRDLKGKVVEGDEDDIRAVYYLFALQPFDADATTTAAGAGAGAAEEAADGEGDGEGEEPTRRRRRRRRGRSPSSRSRAACRPTERGGAAPIGCPCA